MKLIERKKVEEILKKLQTEVLPLNEKEKEKRLEQARDDFFFFFETYLPHYKEHPFARFHYELFSLINRESEPPFVAAIAAPRGFAKSTIVSFAYVIWSILFRKRKFIIIFSATDDLASDIVDFIRLELLYNKRIEQDFGKVLSGRYRENDFFANGVRVFSRSVKQMSRGFKFRQYRPDLIILDDIETDEKAKSNKATKELLTKILRGIYPSMSPKGTLIIIGTIISRKSVLGEILLNTDPEKPYANWTKKIYKALDVDKKGRYISLWKERFPVEKLLQIKETIGTIEFNREFCNTPDDEANVFSESWLQYYSSMPVGLSLATFVDPSVDKTGDYKAIITVGFDKQTVRYYVIEVWLKKTSIEAMLSKVFDTYIKYKPDVIGFEANGFQKILAKEFELFAKSRGVHPPLKLITHTRNKQERIIRLSPLVERGAILFKHPKEATDDTALLIEQLLFFPDSDTNDDGPDALEGAISILENYSTTPSFTPVKRRQIFSILRGF